VRSRPFRSATDSRAVLPLPRSWGRGSGGEGPRGRSATSVDAPRAVRSYVRRGLFPSPAVRSFLATAGKSSPARGGGVGREGSRRFGGRDAGRRQGSSEAQSKFSPSPEVAPKLGEGVGGRGPPDAVRRLSTHLVPFAIASAGALSLARDSLVPRHRGQFSPRLARGRGEAGTVAGFRTYVARAESGSVQSGFVALPFQGAFYAERGWGIGSSPPQCDIRRYIATCRSVSLPQGVFGGGASPGGRRGRRGAAGCLSRRGRSTSPRRSQLQPFWENRTQFRSLSAARLEHAGTRHQAPGTWHLAPGTSHFKAS
jgi:hypothetical protein